MRLILTGDAGVLHLNPDEVDELKCTESVDRGPTVVYFHGCCRVLARESVNEIMGMMHDEVVRMEAN